jgi:hypothetical protein
VSKRNKYAQTEEIVTKEEVERREELLVKFSHKFHTSGDFQMRSIANNENNEIKYTQK